MIRDDDSLVGALRSLRPSDFAELLVVAAFVVAIIVVAIAIGYDAVRPS
jgi:hypothetical protein